MRTPEEIQNDIDDVDMSLDTYKTEMRRVSKELDDLNSEAEGIEENITNLQDRKVDLEREYEEAYNYDAIPEANQ